MKKIGFACLKVAAVGVVIGASAVFIAGMAAMDVYHKILKK